jgi:hypothetical protein
MFPSDDCDYCAGSTLSLQRLIQCGRFPRRLHKVRAVQRFHKFPAFVEQKVSFPYKEEAATASCLEIDESSSHPVSARATLILSSHQKQSGLFLNFAD